MPKRDVQIRPGRSSRYHFDSLPSDLRRLYVPLRNAVIEGRTEVALESSYSEDGCMKAMESVLMDNPQAFWVGFPVTMEARGGTVSMKMTKTGFYSKSEEIKERLKKTAEDIYSREVEGLKDPYDIESAVHDAIVSKVRYDKSDPSTAHSLIGPLLKKRGVCDGISAGIAFLLNAYGVECSVVTGRKRGEGEDHAWNVVKIGKEWYHMDATFDIGCGKDGEVSHAFFNMDDKMASRTHDFTPAGRCTSMKHNYYVKKSSYMRYQTEAESYIGRTHPKGGTYELYVEGPSDVERLMWAAAVANSGAHVRCSHTEGRFRIRVDEQKGGRNADIGTPQKVRDAVRLQKQARDGKKPSHDAQHDERPRIRKAGREHGVVSVAQFPRDVGKSADRRIRQARNTGFRSGIEDVPGQGNAAGTASGHGGTNFNWPLLDIDVLRESMEASQSRARHTGFPKGCTIGKRPIHDAGDRIGEDDLRYIRTSLERLAADDAHIFGQDKAA
jgi:hypothetical protein